MRLRSAALLGCALALVGCTEEGTVGTHDPAPGPASCDDPAEIALPSGDCIRPGVGVDGCAAGFEHDGMHGCTPILPPDDCPPGLMAVPGDAACRAVMECGSGKWGDIPVDATTEYVDANYGGGDSDGSEAKPWVTLAEAYAAAEAGAVLALAAGDYSGGLEIRVKPVRVWGVCPEQVTIRGAAAPACGLVGLCFLDGAHGSEVGGVTLTGTGSGVGMSDVTAVVIDRVRMFANSGRGVTAESTRGPVGFTLRDSLVESNTDYGVSAMGTDMLMERTVVRDTAPEPSGEFGVGVNVQVLCYNDQCYPDQPSRAEIRGSLVERNHEFGIFVSGSEAIVEGTVVRGTLPHAGVQRNGRGITARPSCLRLAGVLSCDVDTSSLLAVSGSLFEDNHGAGIQAIGSQVSVERTVVRRTKALVDSQVGGQGISASLMCFDDGIEDGCRPGTGADLQVRESTLEESQHLGLSISASTATLDAVVIRSTAPRALDGLSGRGLSVQMSCVDTDDGSQVCDPLARSSATVTRSLIDSQFDVGVFVGGADLVLDSSVVRATAVQTDGLFGDGIAVLTREGASASVEATNVAIHDSARAGLASFGGAVALERSHVVCAGFSLFGEDRAEFTFAFDDRGDNLCGCPQPNEACKLATTALEPPQASAEE
jgi:hypothetical protein